MAEALTITAFLQAQKPLAQRHLTRAVMLGLLGGALVMLQAWLLASVVNAVLFASADLEAVSPWLMPMLAVFAARAGAAWAAEQAAFQAGAVVRHELRAKLFEHVLRLGPVRLAGEPTGKLVSALTDSIEALNAYYARYLPAISLTVMLPFAILAVVFPRDWISGLVLLLTAPMIPLFMVLIGRGAERLNQRQWQRLARMSGHLLDVIQGLTTLKLFNASRREAETVARMAEAYRRDTMSVLRLAFLSTLALEFFATVSIAVVAVLIGFRLLWGEMAFSDGLLVLLLAPEFYLPLRNMGTQYHARMDAIGAAERIMEILTLPPPPERKGRPASLHSSRSIAIAFEDVAVDFPDGRRALNGLSFRIEAGERVAIVGPSGAGKSTVLNLLLGFVEPTAGRILVDGVPLGVLDLKLWRRHITWVPQRPHLFHGSVRDNIALNRNLGSETDFNAVKTAAAKAHAESFIATLPHGYDTMLGERGAGLSGGEAQRLTLARAFYRDTPLVLMDEAVAHLDAETETRIGEAIRELARGRTLLMIAHRLETIRDAGRILVLEHGRLAEEGPHHALVKGRGLYARMTSAARGVEGTFA